MKDKSQLEESVHRFQSSFWDKKATRRPPIGIAGDEVFMPINYLRGECFRSEIVPEDIGHELCMTDHECCTASRRVFSDDWIPFSAAWRAVPWLEAICGCSVRCSTGSLGPDHVADSVDELMDIPIPADKRWFECLQNQTQQLAATAPDDCWISPTILRGPSDVLAAMRGLSGFYCDIYDDIGAIDQAACRVNKLLLDVLDMHFSIIQPKMGGYGHFYGYWAPARSIIIQEDVLGMCSPEIYRNVFMKYNTQVVEHLGAHVLFHLHSTGFGHYKDVLRIPGLAGLQITIEANGPALVDMLPVLREILEQSRLILFVDHYFEQLTKALQKLPKEGLYLLLSNKFIHNEEEFKRSKAIF